MCWRASSASSRSRACGGRRRAGRGGGGRRSPRRPRSSPARTRATRRRRTAARARRRRRARAAWRRTRPAVEIEASAGKDLARSLGTRAIRRGLAVGGTALPGRYPAPSMPFFRHEGNRLAYTIYGDGPADVVLLHGLLLSQQMHVPLAQALAERGNRVVTLDLLGHGRSDRPRDMWRYSMPLLRRAGHRAAGPPRDRRGGRRRHLAGRQHDARGRGALAPERLRGMVIEMPVLDNALLGCAIAFTPLMVALTFGEPVMRLVARGARLVPTGAARSGRRRPRLVRQDPGPSAAVLQGLFFGRIAPHRERASSRRRRWSSATGATRSTRSPTPACSPTSCPTRRLVEASRSSSCACARAADRRDRRLRRRAAGSPGAAAVRRARAASPRLPFADGQPSRGEGTPAPGAPGPGGGGPQSGDRKRRCRSSAAPCSASPWSR